MNMEGNFGNIYCRSTNPLFGSADVRRGPGGLAGAARRTRGTCRTGTRARVRRRGWRPPRAPRGVKRNSWLNLSMACCMGVIGMVLFKLLWYVCYATLMMLLLFRVSNNTSYQQNFTRSSAALLPHCRYTGVCEQKHFFCASLGHANVGTTALQPLILAFCKPILPRVLFSGGVLFFFRDTGIKESAPWQVVRRGTPGACKQHNMNT